MLLYLIRNEINRLSESSNGYRKEKEENMSTIMSYIKEIITAFKKDNIPILAAAQAYYYLLSIVPLLITCFAILPYLNLEPTEVMRFAEDILPNEIASVLEDNIINIIDTPKNGLLTIGILGTLWSASSGINAFLKSINEAYEIDETRSFIKLRLTALLLTIGLIISFIIALLLPVFGDVILQMVTSIFPMEASFIIILQLVKWIISVLVIAGVLLILYRFAPNKQLPFKHIVPGALTASLLWLLISMGFSFYVAHFGNYSATYGSLGGLIVLMIWFFLTGMILMIGAEVNVLYHKKHR